MASHVAALLARQYGAEPCARIHRLHAPQVRKLKPLLLVQPDIRERSIGQKPQRAQVGNTDRRPMATRRTTPVLARPWS